jgi:hypothetical protein
MALALKKKKAEIYIDSTKSEEELLIEFLSKLSKYVDKEKANSLGR